MSGGGDFLGVFGVLRRGDRVLMVANDRRIDGCVVRTWDLPGGGVEPGELLDEALAREFAEETGLVVQGRPEFLFVQEGQRVARDRRLYAWRSFFFAVDVAPGEPIAGAEVRAVRWLGPDEMERELTAPYHDSFRAWRRDGGLWFRSVWRDRGDSADSL